MNFTKIHFKSGDPELALDWEETTVEGHHEKYQYKGDAPPLPSLPAALEALKPHFLEIMELDEEYGEGMNVLGVTLNWKKDKETGEKSIKSATISVKKKLQELTNDVVPISSPHTESGLSDACKAAIDALCGEAERYLDGERAQGELFAGGDGAAEDRPPAPGNVVPIGDTEAVRKHAELETEEA